MQQLRLIGLALFITAIFLAMAAAITRTTQIRLQTSGVGDAPPTNDSMVLPPPDELGFNTNDPTPNAQNPVPYASVPIVWPLIIAAGVGLLMWFMPSSDTPSSSYESKPRSGRRRN